MAIQDEKATPELVGNTIKSAIKVEDQKPKQRIYIGPNMLQLTTYTVLESKFPAHLAALIEKCPAIEKLFVPVTELTTLEPRISQKGTIEHRHYQNVLEFVANKERE